MLEVIFTFTNVVFVKLDFFNYIITIYTMMFWIQKDAYLYVAQ